MQFIKQLRDNLMNEKSEQINFNETEKKQIIFNLTANAHFVTYQNHMINLKLTISNLYLWAEQMN